MTGAPPGRPAPGDTRAETGAQGGGSQPEPPPVPGPAAGRGHETAPGSGSPAPAQDRPPQLWKALFFALAVVAIVAGVAWALLGSRFLIVRSVKVDGSGRLVSRQQVLTAAAIPAGLPLIRVNAGAVARRVERIPQVLSATVHRDWPGTVVITVRLRTPVFAVRDVSGYELVDPYGVDVRNSAHRPPGLPLLSVGTTAAGGSLRGLPSVHAAAVVLGELPARLGRRVRSVTAYNPSEVTLRLTHGVVIVWGDTSRPAEKARELAVLMRTHARYYDVSAPGSAVTKG